MEKILIKAYFKNNLGDDLFLKIVSERYEKEFIAICSPKYKYLSRYRNIRFNKSYIEYYIYRIVEKILKKPKILEKKFLKKADILLTIGGSIFIENKMWSQEEIKEVYPYDKPHYILGANFGPYHSENYKDNIEKIVFNNAQDVCFRDNYSYDLFKKNKIIRKAPDIIFSLDVSNIRITEKKKIVISVIDCSGRFSKEISDQYDKTIIKIINYFVNKKYEIVLMSFCKKEGDEKAINRIKKTCNKELRRKIKHYYYRGNINEALSILGDSKIVFGSRFHANILGLIMNKTIIPIAYSDKTINVMRDINFKGKIIDIRKIKEFSINELTEDDLNYKCDVGIQKKEAEKHFEKLDVKLKGVNYE